MYNPPSSIHPSIHPPSNPPVPPKENAHVASRFCPHRSITYPIPSISHPPSLSASIPNSLPLHIKQNHLPSPPVPFPSPPHLPYSSHLPVSLGVSQKQPTKTTPPQDPPPTSHHQAGSQAGTGGRGGSAPHDSSAISRWTSASLRSLRRPSSSGAFPSRTAPKSRICLACC